MRAAAEPLPLACAVETLPRPADNGKWIYTWHDDILQFDSPSEGLDSYLYDLFMNHAPKKSLPLDEVMSIFGELNQPGPSRERHLPAGGFLLLYDLLQGATEVRLVQKNSSQSLARLLLPFVPAYEPSLLSSIILTLARAPLLAPFMPPLPENRIMSRVST